MIMGADGLELLGDFPIARSARADRSLGPPYRIQKGGICPAKSFRGLLGEASPASDKSAAPRTPRTLLSPCNQDLHPRAAESLQWLSS